MLVICSGSRAKSSASEAARGQGDANGLRDGARFSPELAGDGDGARRRKMAGAGEDALDDRGFGSSISNAHELRRAQAKLVTQVERRLRGWSEL